MAQYQLLTNELRKRAIDRGYPATGSGIAEAVGLHPWTLSHLVSGKPPSSRTMATLVTAFDCSTEDIFRLIRDNGGDVNPEARTEAEE